MTEPATHFRDTVQAFLERIGTAPARLGADVLGDSSFVVRLRRGSSPRLDTVERVRAWMAAHCGAAERAAIRVAIVGPPPPAMKHFAANIARRKGIEPPPAKEEWRMTPLTGVADIGVKLDLASCCSPSATSLPSKLNNVTTPCWTSQPWSA